VLASHLYTLIPFDRTRVASNDRVDAGRFPSACPLDGVTVAWFDPSTARPDLREPAKSFFSPGRWWIAARDKNAPVESVESLRGYRRRCLPKGVSESKVNSPRPAAACRCNGIGRTNLLPANTARPPCSRFTHASFPPFHPSPSAGDFLSTFNFVPVYKLRRMFSKTSPADRPISVLPPRPRLRRKKTWLQFQ
jgi:hypothetical protein